MTKAKGYVGVEYLKLAAELTRPVKEASYERMRLKPGAKVLDVGCGPGTDTLILARLLGSQGRVVGIDFDAEMVSKANEHAQAAGLTHQVIHRLGDALQLPFEVDEFDASRSERLFQHLAQPEIALQEMVRVTKPNGWVVVSDTDWGTSSIDTEFTDLERRLTRVLAERTLNNGYSGRRLYRLFKQVRLADITIDSFSLFTPFFSVFRLISGFDNVKAEAIRSGIATQEECSRFNAKLQDADDEGVFYASAVMVLASGRKIK